MIPNATLILGPPGCGKTYTLIERVEAKLQEGVHPSRIGVVSFTTKAIGEFVDRACAKFNLTKNDFPHFRTLHANYRAAWHNATQRGFDEQLAR